MSVTTHRAIQMQHVQILLEISLALANPDSTEMDNTVQTSMSALIIHVILMQLAPTIWDHIHVCANLAILEMEHNVMI
jgi:hypothetical protein